MKKEEYRKLYQTMYYHQAGDIDVLAKYIGVTKETLQRLSKSFEKVEKKDLSLLSSIEKNVRMQKQFSFYVYLGGYTADDLIMHDFSDSRIYEEASSYANLYGTKEERAAFFLQRAKRGKPGKKEEQIRDGKVAHLIEILKKQNRSDTMKQLANFFGMKSADFRDSLLSLDKTALPKYLEMAGSLQMKLPVSKKEVFYHVMFSSGLEHLSIKFGVSANSLAKAIRDYYQDATPLEQSIYLFCIQRKQMLEEYSLKNRQEAKEEILYEVMKHFDFNLDRMEEMAEKFGISVGMMKGAIVNYRKLHHISFEKQKPRNLESIQRVLDQAESYVKKGITMSNGFVRPYDFVDFYMQFAPFTLSYIDSTLNTALERKQFQRWKKRAYNVFHDSCGLTSADILADPEKYKLQQQITFPDGTQEIMTLFDNLDLRKQCVNFMKENHLTLSGTIMKSLLERSRYGNSVYEVPSDMEFVQPERWTKTKKK